MTKIPAFSSISYPWHDDVVQQDKMADALALRQLCDAYCELYDAAPVSYLTVDMDGVIMSANRMAATLLGVEKSRLHNRKITEFIVGEDQDIYYFHNQMLQRSRNWNCCELRLCRGDGQVFYGRLDSMPGAMRGGDDLVYRMAIIDIHDKKTREVELRDMLEKARSANIAKSEFLASMSHEIRTPLNAIIGIIDILKRGDFERERQELYMHTLEESAGALRALINDMLDFAKIESRMLDLEIKPFNLFKVVQESVHIVSVKAEEKRLRLDIDYPQSVPAVFLGDALRIRQILLNLLNNAIKFTETGGVSVGVAIDANGISIAVRDTGIGIPGEMLGAIFSKYTQQNSAVTGKYGGTGLGLSICRELVRLMGGRIEVASEVGRGSVFTLHIPLEPSAGSVDDESFINHRAALPAAGKLPGRVLLVEDSKANILVATHLLSSFGYEYEVAQNSHEALRKMEEGDFSIVLMDIQMEGRDGIETTRIIRDMEERRRQTPVAIIAMTAHALIGDKEKCLEAGMDGYISKPVNADELEATLARFAGKAKTPV